MATKTLTKTSAEFNEVRIIKKSELVDETPTDKWFLQVDYVVKTSQGEDLGKSREVELKGANLATAQDIFTKVQTVRRLYESKI